MAKPKNTSHSGAGQLRIIGGEWRSRKLDFPHVEGLRPTPDRVRETLFNWLGQELDGWHCLDLFAGSGALGFEAASRGAARVVMIEQAPKVLAALHENHELLHKPSGVEIIRADAIQYLASTQAKFDLIFLDPPYKKGWKKREQCWPSIGKRRDLCASGRGKSGSHQAQGSRLVYQASRGRQA